MEKVKTPVKISDSEWEIMRVIWTLGQTTAQEITQILADSMDWKPATIKTLLGRLVKRSDLDRTRRKNSFIIQLFLKWTQCAAQQKTCFRTFVLKESAQPLLI